MKTVQSSRVGSAIGGSDPGLAALSRSESPSIARRPSVDRRGSVPSGRRGGHVPAAPAPPVVLGGKHEPQGNDRISGDFPMVNGRPTLPAEWKKNGVAELTARRLSSVSNAELLSMFRLEYRVASHSSSAGTAQYERFATSAGGTVTSMPGSVMSSLVSTSGEGRSLGETFTSRLKDAAQAQYLATGRVEPRNLTIPIELSDRLSWGTNPTSPLFGLLGSTDGVGATLRDARHDAGHRRLTGTLRITVVDRFGLSNLDNDSPGQIAMWLLQHQRGFASFENRIVYDVPLDVTLEARPVLPCKRGTQCRMP